jgi:hypothetical protein
LGNWVIGVFRQKPQLPNYPINCFENPKRQVNGQSVNWTFFFSSCARAAQTTCKIYDNAIFDGCVQRGN